MEQYKKKKDSGGFPIFLFFFCLASCVVNWKIITKTEQDTGKTGGWSGQNEAQQKYQVPKGNQFPPLGINHTW